MGSTDSSLYVVDMAPEYSHNLRLALFTRTRIQKRHSSSYDISAPRTEFECSGRDSLTLGITTTTHSLQGGRSGSTTPDSLLTPHTYTPVGDEDTHKRKNEGCSFDETSQRTAVFQREIQRTHFWQPFAHDDSRETRWHASASQRVPITPVPWHRSTPLMAPRMDLDIVGSSYPTKKVSRVNTRRAGRYRGAPKGNTRSCNNRRRQLGSRLFTMTQLTQAFFFFFFPHGRAKEEGLIEVSVCSSPYWLRRTTDRSRNEKAPAVQTADCTTKEKQSEL